MQLSDLLAYISQPQFAGPQLTPLPKAQVNATATNIPAVKVPPLSSPADMMNALTNSTGGIYRNQLLQQQAAEAGLNMQMLKAQLGMMQQSPEMLRQLLSGAQGGSAGGAPPAGTTGAAPETVGGAVDPLSLIRQKESGGDYNIGFGGADLSKAPTDASGFPQWSGAQGPQGKSHAAGAYQFEPATWKHYAGQLGINDFSPASQDAVARAAYADQGMKPWAPYNPSLAAAVGANTGASGNASSFGSLAPNAGVQPNGTAAGGSSRVRGIDPLALAAYGAQMEAYKLPNMSKPILDALYKDPEYLQRAAGSTKAGELPYVGPAAAAAAAAKLPLTPVNLRQGGGTGLYDTNGRFNLAFQLPKLAEGQVINQIPGGGVSASMVPGAAEGITAATHAGALGHIPIIPGVGAVDLAAAAAAQNSAPGVPPVGAPNLMAGGATIPASPTAPPAQVGAPAVPTPGAPSLPGAVPPQAGLLAPVQSPGQKGAYNQNLETAEKQITNYHQQGQLAVDQAAQAAAITDLLGRVRMGWGAGTVQEGARILSALGAPEANVQALLGTNPSAGDELNKLFMKFSADAVRQMGAREPGSVISMFAKAYPNLETMPNAALMMTNALQMQSQWMKDRANAAEQWNLSQQRNAGRFGENYQGMQGFEQQFGQTNNPRDYWKAAAAMSGDAPVAWDGATREQKQRILALIPPGAKVTDWSGRQFQKPSQ